MFGQGVNFEHLREHKLVLPGKYIPSWKSTYFCFQKDSVVKKKKVKFGPVVANGTTILEGVEEGDTVVVSYSRRPSDGEKVVVELKDSDVTKNEKASREKSFIYLSLSVLILWMFVAFGALPLSLFPSTEKPAVKAWLRYTRLKLR